MVTQILNFGLPAPIDVQIEGADVAANRKSRTRFWSSSGMCPGSRTCASSRLSTTRSFISRWTAPRPRGRLQPARHRDRLLISLSGSFQTAPIFFLNEQNGVNYSLVTQTPQYAFNR
jgi:hypothetical protein